MTPSKSLPLIIKSLGTSAPPVNKTASYLFCNSLIVISTPTLILVLIIKPSFSNCSCLLSINFFSILKSGIPYLNKPPILLFFSYKETLWPALTSCCAAAMPAGPEPIIAMLLPVFSWAGSGLIKPFSHALSTIAHSIDLIATGLSSRFKVQAASQGAGQILPVNSGKLLVE